MATVADPVAGRIVGQTRTLIIANVGTVLSLAALAFGIAKLT